jgi:hypothetical protein
VNAARYAVMSCPVSLAVSNARAPGPLIGIWSRADMPAPANDPGAPAVSAPTETRRER